MGASYAIIFLIKYLTMQKMFLALVAIVFVLAAASCSKPSGYVKNNHYYFSDDEETKIRRLSHENDSLSQTLRTIVVLRGYRDSTTPVEISEKVFCLNGVKLFSETKTLTISSDKILNTKDSSCYVINYDYLEKGINGNFITYQWTFGGMETQLAHVTILKKNHGEHDYHAIPEDGYNKLQLELIGANYWLRKKITEANKS